MTQEELPYIKKFRDRHGKTRRYFRKKGQKLIPLPGRPGEVEFQEAYAAALATVEGEGRRSHPSHPGSVDELVERYYGSMEWQGLAPATRVTRRGVLERFREKHGSKPVRLLGAGHIKAILAAKMTTAPAAAYNLRKVLRLLFEFGVEEGLVDVNPLAKVKPIKRKGKGFHTWTEEEIKAFEKRWEIGTKERLAFGLFLYTAQRRSDVAKMAPHHINGGMILVSQQKTGARVAIPIHPELEKVLQGSAFGEKALLVTKAGLPYTAAGLGNWFREAVKAAGLKDMGAHGLRKAACRRLAEAGCSAKEIMAISGHKTLAEVERYVAQAEQRVLAQSAMEKLNGA